MRRARWITVALVVATMTVVPMVPVQTAPRIEWMRRAGTDLAAVAVAPGGGAVVTGAVWMEEGPNGLVVRWYGPGGGLVWSRTWTPRKGVPYGTDVTVAPDRSIYVVGGVGCAKYETGGFFIRKYGPLGGVRWTRVTRGGWCLHGSATEHATGVGVGGGLVVVVGHEYGCCGMTLDDGWIRAYRTDGRHAWTRDFEVPDVRSETNDALEGVVLDGTGGAYVAGRVEMAPRTDTTVRVDQELVVQKLSRNGSRLWTWMVRDSGVQDEDSATGIAFRDGRVAVTGRVDGRRYVGSSGWLGRFTTDGRLLWARRWGGGDLVVDASGVSLTSSSASLVVGTTHVRLSRDADLFLCGVGSDGRMLWKTRVGGPAWVEGTAIEAFPGGAYTTGIVIRNENQGRLWRWRI
jgi:hypothetical protein